jgi:Zn-dependent M32 family carboxypeptidase
MGSGNKIGKRPHTAAKTGSNLAFALLLTLTVCALAPVAFFGFKGALERLASNEAGTGGTGGNGSGGGSCGTANTTTDYTQLSNVPQQCYGIAQTNASVCGGNGQCVWLNECVCTKPYYGSQCQSKLAGTWCFEKQSTDAGVCSSHGTCTQENKCTCASGYGGDNCQNDLHQLYDDIMSEQMSYTGLTAVDANIAYLLAATTVGTQAGASLTSAQRDSINAKSAALGKLKADLLNGDLVGKLLLLGDISADSSFTAAQKDNVAAVHKVLDRVLPMAQLGDQFSQLTIEGNQRFAQCKQAFAQGPGAGWATARSTATAGWEKWKQLFAQYGQIRGISKPYDAAMSYYNTGLSTDKMVDVLTNAGTRLGALYMKLLANQTAYYDVATAKMRAYNLTDAAKMSDLDAQMQLLADVALPLIRADPTYARRTLSDAWSYEFAAQSPMDSGFVVAHSDIPKDYLSPEVVLHEACHTVQFGACAADQTGTMVCSRDSQDFIVSEGFATYCESLTQNVAFVAKLHAAAKQKFPLYVKQDGATVDVVKQLGFAGFRGAYRTLVHQINGLVMNLERAYFNGQITVDQFFDQISALVNQFYGYPAGTPSASIVFIHWHTGLWAYLNGYDLGVYGWQQMAAHAIAGNADIASAFQQGDFRPLMDWFKQGPLANMHKYNIEQMVKVYTNEDFSPDAYVWSMEKFYADLAGLQVAKSAAYVPATATQQYSSGVEQALAFAKFSGVASAVSGVANAADSLGYFLSATSGADANDLSIPVVPMPEAVAPNSTVV